MNEAWSWYRAILRSSRHVGKHGVIIERLVGASIHEKAVPRILSQGSSQGRVALGVTPQGSHRSGRARQTHPVRHVVRCPSHVQVVSR
jgi:hypothetical protein